MHKISLICHSLEVKTSYSDMQEASNIITVVHRLFIAVVELNQSHRIGGWMVEILRTTSLKSYHSHW